MHTWGTGQHSRAHCGYGGRQHKAARWLQAPVSIVCLRHHVAHRGTTRNERQPEMYDLLHTCATGATQSSRRNTLPVRGVQLRVWLPTFLALSVLCTAPVRTADAAAHGLGAIAVKTVRTDGGTVKAVHVAVSTAGSHSVLQPPESTSRHLALVSTPSPVHGRIQKHGYLPLDRCVSCSFLCSRGATDLSVSKLKSIHLPC